MACSLGRRLRQAHLHRADGAGAPAAANLNDMVILSNAGRSYERVQLRQLRVLQAGACTVTGHPLLVTTHCSTCLHVSHPLAIRAARSAQAPMHVCPGAPEQCAMQVVECMHVLGHARVQAPRSLPGEWRPQE